MNATYRYSSFRIAACIFLLSANLFPMMLIAQKPNISYRNPNVLTVDAPMIPIGPTNTGGAVPAVIRGTISVVAGANDAAIGSTNGQGDQAKFNRPGGLAVDLAGNVYVADKDNNSIRKITPGGLVSTLAVGMNHPWGLVVNNASGDIYVSDHGSHQIKRITPLGQVTVYAGSTAGYDDGSRQNAKFNGPQDLLFDNAGNLYIADSGNRLIRKISPQGEVTTVAGNRSAGNANGQGAAASFNSANGLTLDINGNLIISDYNNNLIRKMTPSGLVSTFAGNGFGGFADGQVNAASLYNPSHLATDYAGNIYVSDSRNDRIRKITPAGAVTTIAGNGVRGDGIGNGAPLQAEFYNPVGLAYDRFANLYISDEHNNKIKKLALGGYTINRALPQGLVFDQTTGIISGTPTQLRVAEDYIITAINGFGESSTTVTIQVIPTAVYMVRIVSRTLCDESFDPGALSNSPITYTSDNHSVAVVLPNGLIDIVGNGFATITATNELGESDSKVLEVSDYPIPLISINSDRTVVCPGTDAVLTASTSMAGRDPLFEWYRNGELVQSGSDRIYRASDPKTTDEFTCKVTNQDYCITVVSQLSNVLKLTPVPPPPTTRLSVNPAEASCPGTILSFDGNITGGFVSDTGPFPSFYVNGKEIAARTQRFSSDKLKDGDVVTFVHPYSTPCGPAGRAVSNEVVVRYRKAELCSIMPPTAFSPNGDGINDSWNIEYLVGFPQCHIQVYSRFGQKLFDQIGYTTPWDGKSKGADLPAGTYYYVIALEKDMETVSGTITIIK